MRRRFNITGSCNPQRHYMIRLDDRLKRIKEDYIDDGSYFVINRGRQYGKTTTLNALEKYLKNEYIVLSLDFQEVETANFVNGVVFSQTFAKKLSMAFRYIEIEKKEKLQELLLDFKKNTPEGGLDELFECLSNMCENSPRPIVLMIDEVDSASNNQVFIDFLSQLRGYYLKRDKTPIFQSVILAGVYDIKNLKLKLRPESEHQYNSPWNIAAKFKIDMSFSTKQIAGMLKEYEADYHTGMDIQAVAEEIYEYTSGYPVLISSICKYIDEDLPEEEEAEDSSSLWSEEGVRKAVKRILIDNIPLFESMVRHLDEYPAMKQMFQTILFQGSEFAYNPDTKEINLACMFGYAVDKMGRVEIANRIFETRLYNYFLSEEELSSAIGNMAKRDKSYFIQGGRLDMDTALRKFVEYFTEIYGDNDTEFIEMYGRKLFLLYLKPIINGTGNYYIEAQTRDARRTDVIVDYLGEQFIIELKIWHGNEYNERGEQQIVDYLDYYHKDKGYLLSFNFNKKKEIGVKEIKMGGKTIIEAVV
ncbi:MAG: AAA-like domain-containing protein [Blautia sp.]|nr:AAA-like domain-containing protein [Lachnoclostridium sp.]MCM1210167.1 AAA-like domain-containing protein [Blautia sp.]